MPENSEFTHLILTFFNMDCAEYTYIQEKFNINQIFIDEAWLTKRLELFEKYTLESMKAQTNKDFIWCVFFHPDSPKMLFDKIEQYKKEFPNFRPCFMKRVFELQNYIKNNIQYNRWLITSRVDSDDAYCKDFVQNIHDNFKPQHKCFLDFIKGYSYDAQNSRLKVIEYPSNAFNSCIEDTNISFRTAYGYNHSFLKDHGFLNSITTKPMWMQIIHDGNISNIFRGKNANFREKLDFLNRVIIKNAKVKFNIKDLFSFLFYREKTNTHYIWYILGIKMQFPRKKRFKNNIEQKILEYNSEENLKTMIDYTNSLEQDILAKNENNSMIKDYILALVRAFELEVIHTEFSEQQQKTYNILVQYFSSVDITQAEEISVASVMFKDIKLKSNTFETVFKN